MLRIIMDSNNKYTRMQKEHYDVGTSNHEEHNENSDYWNILLSDVKDNEYWKGKRGLDFACGKGRNVISMYGLCLWDRVDGVDLSQGNIDFCKTTYQGYNSNWYCNNGTDVSELESNYYDFIMSTIALQHIPVYDIRKSLITDLLRTLKSGGLFSFQMGYGSDLHDPMGVNRPRSAYFDNAWDASGTNSSHDVRVQSEKEIVDDLLNIGYVNISTKVKKSFSDAGHTHWIYVKAYKK